MKQIGFIPASLRTTRRLPCRASAPKLGRVEPARPAAPVLDLVHHVARAARPVAALAVPQADEIDLVGSEARAPIRASSGCCARKGPRPPGAGQARSGRHEGRRAPWPRNIERANRGRRNRPTFRETSARRKECRARAARRGRARPPRTGDRRRRRRRRSQGPRGRPRDRPAACAIARAAIGSLSGGKRGFSRPGASIMWPLNSATLRGGAGLMSDMELALRSVLRPAPWRRSKAAGRCSGFTCFAAARRPSSARSVKFDGSSILRICSILSGVEIDAELGLQPVLLQQHVVADVGGELGARSDCRASCRRPRGR